MYEDIFKPLFNSLEILERRLNLPSVPSEPPKDSNAPFSAPEYTHKFVTTLLDNLRSRGANYERQATFYALVNLAKCQQQLSRKKPDRRFKVPTCKMLSTNVKVRRIIF